MPKVHWYMIDPHLDPPAPYGVQVVPKGPEMTPTGLIFWNHIWWKSPKISCLLKLQIQKLGEIPQNWENWEIFANFEFTHDILISGRILSENLVRHMSWCLATSVTP